MPNWPVRDQWEYLRKVERHFPIKPGQPIEMALVILNSFTEFPNKGKESVCQKWNGEFRSEYSDRNMWTISRGDPEYSGQKKPKRTFHLNPDRNFRYLWHNGKHPLRSTPAWSLCFENMASASRFSSLSETAAKYPTSLSLALQLQPTVTSASLISVPRRNFQYFYKQRKSTVSEFVFAQRKAAVMDKRKDFTLCVLNTTSPYCILAFVGSLSACC